MIKFFNKKNNNFESNSEVDTSVNQSSRNEAKVISLLNQKGGVGKTTMAFNLARAIMERGKKVLCIDMDPQANLSRFFGHRPEHSEYSVFNLLVNSVRELKPIHRPVLLSDVLIESELASLPDLLPSSQALSGFELTVAGINAPRQLLLKNMLEKSGLKQMYDVIVIDGPPTLGLLMVNILCSSDGVVIPFQADQFSEMGLKNFHGVLEDIGDMGLTQAPKVLGYLPNMYDQRRKQTGADFEKIKSELGSLNQAPHIFEPLMNKVQLVKSAAQHKTVFDYQTQDFKDLQRQFDSMANHIEQELL